MNYIIIIIIIIIKKGQFCAISYCWIEVFLKEVLGLLAYEKSNFMLSL